MPRLRGWSGPDSPCSASRIRPPGRRQCGMWCEATFLRRRCCGWVKETGADYQTQSRDTNIFYAPYQMISVDKIRNPNNWFPRRWCPFTKSPSSSSFSPFERRKSFRRTNRANFQLALFDDFLHRRILDVFFPRWNLSLFTAQSQPVRTERNCRIWSIDASPRAMSTLNVALITATGNLVDQ